MLLMHMDLQKFLLQSLETHSKSTKQTHVSTNDKAGSTKLLRMSLCAVVFMLFILCYQLHERRKTLERGVIIYNFHTSENRN